MSEDRDWRRLKTLTQARIGLGTAGSAISTARCLEFQVAHAQARAAVHSVWDPQSLAGLLPDSLILPTRATRREAYLLDPDLGRHLSSTARETLKSQAARFLSRVVFIVSDGLSAPAIAKHFVPLWNVFSPLFHATQVEQPSSPLLLVPFARVAVSDDVGELLKAELAVIFLGERPGLSSPDSLGIYLTYLPRTGTVDSLRNCISNVRPPHGLSYGAAAQKLIYLINESLRRKISGVQLKDEIDVRSYQKIIGR